MSKGTDEWNTYDSETRETICELKFASRMTSRHWHFHGMGMTVDVINALSEARKPAAGFTGREAVSAVKAAVISNYEAEERASTLNTERRERLPYYGELLVICAQADP